MTFDVLDIYYSYFYLEFNKITFIEELKNDYSFNNENISEIFGSIDNILSKPLTFLVNDILGLKFEIDQAKYLIFSLTQNFLRTHNIQYLKSDFAYIKKALEIYKNSFLNYIENEVKIKNYSINGYETSSDEKIITLTKLEKIRKEVDVLIEIFSQFEDYKIKKIAKNIDDGKIKLNDLNSVNAILNKLLNVTPFNYEDVYSYTGKDIKENLSHLKEVLKDRKDILVSLLNQYGLDIDGKRLSHRIYNKVIESLRKQGIIIEYETAYFQGEIKQEINKIVKEYLIEQKLKDGEELKENEITVLRVDYIENNEDKLLYIGTIGKLGEEDYIRNSLGEVIFYLP